MTSRNLTTALALASAMACALTAALGVGPLKAADDETPTAKTCIVDKDAGFREHNGNYTFAMDLENNCDRKISCTVDVYVTSARGPLNGHGVVLLDPRGQTPTAKSFVMKVKSPNGSAQAERSCKFV